MYATLSSFNAGELSPKMLGRSDVSQYSKGCQTLKNFLVTPYGSAERRPGTRFVAVANSPDIRLVRFVYSSTVSYILEFGNLYIRAFRNDSPVITLNSPYESYELSDLKFIQSADVMTLVHPNHPVMELKRTAVNTFILSEKDFDYPPVLDPNLDDDHTITPSALSGEISLSASKDTFTGENVGAYFQLIHTRRENEISKDFSADGTSDTLEVFGYWTFTTHGTWTGTVTIQRSFDSGATWKDYRTYSSAKDSNTSTSGEEDQENALYRIRMSDYEAASSGTLRLCRCHFVNPDFSTTGVVKITAVTDSKNAAATVIKKIGSVEPTNEWNEGAWSRRRGYPRTVAYFEERMMFGGSAHKPQTVWGSKTNAWNNFLLGDKDDDALEFTLASDTVNTICWMCQHNALVIGTMDSEWALSASDDSAITPSNFRVRRESVFGSEGIPAQMAGDTILFVQRGARKVREYVYQWEKNGYSSPDMTILADHISASGIRETALQQLPDTILWTVLNSGSLAALTYERDQEVVGWHRHETSGKVISCTTIPNGSEDKLYLAVQRNGHTLIEVMQPRAYSSISSAFFVDSGVSLASSDAPLLAVSGLDHLNGLQVQVLADGAVQLPKTVANGRISLDSPAYRVTVGLPYESLLSPMPIELELQNGQSILRSKVIGELRLRLYSSIGGEARSGSGSWQRIISRDVASDSLDSPVIPKNDVITLNTSGGYEKATTIELRQTAPLPFNVTSITALLAPGD